ncbi:MAG: acylphosphatase [Sphingomonas sp.]
MIRRRLVITGKVQGVSYRDWFVARASALGLVGWVRNRADGSVEAVAEGAADAVATIIADARCGPPAARVAAVQVDDEVPPAPLTGFVRRPTV